MCAIYRATVTTTSLVLTSYILFKMVFIETVLKADVTTSSLVLTSYIVQNSIHRDSIKNQEKQMSLHHHWYLRPILFKIVFIETVLKIMKGRCHYNIIGILTHCIVQSSIHRDSIRKPKRQDISTTSLVLTFCIGQKIIHRNRIKKP